MKSKDQTKAQLADELAETPEQTAGLEESATERKRTEEGEKNHEA